MLFQRFFSNHNFGNSQNLSPIVENRNEDCVISEKKINK